MKRNLEEIIKPNQSLKSAARTATANGTEVNLTGFDECLIFIDAGVVTDGTHTITVQTAPTSGGTFTTVSGFSLALTSAVDDQPRVGSINLRKKDKFLRAVTTVSGATTGGVYSVSIIGGSPTIEPVTQVGAVIPRVE